MCAGVLDPPATACNGRVDASDHDKAMTQSTRKLLGTLLLLLSIVVHSAVAMTIYFLFLGDSAPWWLLILFFGIAGSLWFFPASWIIRWMSKPDA